MFIDDVRQSMRIGASRQILDSMETTDKCVALVRSLIWEMNESPETEAIMTKAVMDGLELCSIRKETANQASD